MANIGSFPDDILQARRVHHIFDDFAETIDTTNKYEQTDTDTAATKAVADGANGIFTVTNNTNDNDEYYLASRYETFLVGASRSIHAKFRIQYSEANTDDANIMVGLANAVAANLIVDNGAGPRTSGNIICVEKRDGETKWRLSVYDNDGAQSTLSSITAGGSSYVDIEIMVEERGSSNGTQVVTAKINGDQMRPNATPQSGGIALTFSTTSATEMQLFFGVKNGGTNAETLNVDYWYAAQDRSART